MAWTKLTNDMAELMAELVGEVELMNFPQENFDAQWVTTPQKAPPKNALEQLALWLCEE